MIINITEYLANSLLTIFTMDLSYFESSVPITGDIVNIMLCVGWALLLGNLVFQAMKSMMTGLGFEGEDPRTLFGRTFVMSFLLVGSRQVCDIGLGITKKIIDWLQVPTIVQVPQLTEATFSVPGDASWLLVIIIGIILIIQIVKLFFEIGERYVIVAILTILSPLAFAMGGSKNTSDIFKGWVRMFASMCMMMVLSIVFLKFILSAMSVVPTGVAVIPWCVFIVAIARTGRKIDGIIARVGLNPAITGDPLGHSRMPGMLSYMVIKNMTGSIGKSADASKSGGSKSGGGASRPSLTSGAPSSGAVPVRPPIGSSGGASKVGTTAPASTSSSHTTAGTALPAESAAHLSASALTPGRDTGSSGSPITTPGSTGKTATRPPITATASTDKTSSAKPATTGAHGVATPDKATAARPSAESPHGTASADKSKPSTARPATASTWGTAAADKIPSAKPVSASADKPISARPATGSTPTKDVSSSSGRSAAYTSESTASSSASAKGHSTDAPKAATPIAMRPTADIKSADTAKGGVTPDTSAKTGIPPASSAKAGMPLTDKIRPAMTGTDKTAGAITSRGESVKTAKDSLSEAGRATRPASAVIDSGRTTRPVSATGDTGKTTRPARPVTSGSVGTRTTAGTPKPDIGSSKSSGESRPSDASVINKTGDVNQKGGNVSQSQTNSTNVTLQQKAIAPKRSSPEVTTARGEHSRPPAGKIPTTPKTSGAGVSKPASSETAKTGTVSGGDSGAAQNKGLTERSTRGSAKESYRNATSRPDNKITPKNETAKTSGTSSQTVKNAGASVSAKTSGSASTTNNAGVTNTTLSQSGISTSKPPSVSQGAPSRTNNAARPNTVNNVNARNNMSKPTQGNPTQTGINNNTANVSGKNQKQPQTSTGIDGENKDRLRSRPPYKPSGGDKPDDKKGVNINER